MFIETNPNPQQKRVGDCTVRALALALGETWDSIFLGLVMQAFENKDMPSANQVWGAYLRRRGFTRRRLPDSCPDCYTVADFAAEHPQGIYILAMEQHVVCLIDGAWHDTWDSGDETPIYYWERN